MPNGSAQNGKSIEINAASLYEQLKSEGSIVAMMARYA